MTWERLLSSALLSRCICWVGLQGGMRVSLPQDFQLIRWEPCLGLGCNCALWGLCASVRLCASLCAACIILQVMLLTLTAVVQREQQGYVCK